MMKKKTSKGTVEAAFNVFNWDCTFWQAEEGWEVLTAAFPSSAMRSARFLSAAGYEAGC